MAHLFGRTLQVLRHPPKTIVSGKKHRQATLRLLETKKWGHSAKNNDDAADKLDDWVRLGLQHLRILKQDSSKKEAALKKCDKVQPKILEDILGLINVEVSSQAALAEGDSQQSEQGQPTPSPTNAIAKQTQEPVNPESLPLNLSKVFDAELKITYFKPDNKKPSSSSGIKKTGEGQSPQKHNMFSLHLSAQEKKLLQSAVDTKPIARDGKSQNQRINAKAPKPKKTAKKDQSKKKTASDQKKKEDTEDDDEEREEKPKKGPEKRPEAAPRKYNHEEDEETLKKKIPEGVIQRALNLAHATDKSVPRETRRQRTTSNAYHRCENWGAREGISKDEYQAVGRVAGRMAGAEFDKLWPHPNPKAKAKAKAVAQPKATEKTKVKKKVMKKAMKKAMKKKNEKTEEDTSKTEETRVQEGETNTQNVETEEPAEPVRKSLGDQDWWLALYIFSILRCWDRYLEI